MRWAFGLLLAVGVAGCAAGYARVMGKTLRRVERRDWAGALAKLEKPSGDTNMLLYRLERGLINHYAGDYTASNNQFERAEKLIDRHYTRVSRELASLLTNDAIRPYSGEEFERAFIHYYRALNYHYLGDASGALVECRKANLRLEDFAQAAEYKLSYKNDAFLQYLTGLFFEADGEVNDAFISYRDAAKGYAAYQEAFGLRTPAPLAADLLRTTERLGFGEEWRDAEQRWSLDPKPAFGVPPPQPGTLTVFAESGFIGRKGQAELNLPIMESDNTADVWVVSDRMVYRHRHPGYGGRVKYWLRVALPVYHESRSQVSSVRVRVGDREARGWLVEDLDAIAARSFREKEDTILLRATARALAKWVATARAEKESPFLGLLFNLFGAGTEAADTRSWVSLPKSVWMARVQVLPGTTQVVLEFINAGGRVIDEHVFTDVQMAADRPQFLSWRSFR